MNKTSSKSVISVILRVLSTIIILLVLTVLIPISVPKLLGYGTYNVVSGSMSPEIPVGSLILVEQTEVSELASGDIIAFYRNGIVVCHRILENDAYRQMLTTKGDANESADFEEVSYGQVIGKVARHFALLGAVGEYLTSSSGKLFAIELLALALLLNIIGTKLKEKTET
ncbi:MAG: signal peptidase I [Oscillospiraceae bacterium]|nr:signal peptidase I [Oscillospiraceae bacterium]